MMKIRFLFADGCEVLLRKKPYSVSLIRDNGSPVDRFFVKFFSSEPLFSKEPCGVCAEKDGVLVFTGIVDEHEIVMEKGLRQESFSCRSLAALLLDNEAAPGVLQMPSLRLMERLYLRPLGLCAQGEDFTPKRGQITVEPGTRCWDVLCEFAERFLQCTPHCGRNGTVYFSTRENRMIDLTGLQKLTVTRKSSARISNVVVQNSQTGAYSTVYTMPDTPVTRVRYLSAQADTAPDALFKEAEQEALQVCVVCSGYVDAELEDTVDLSVLSEGLNGLKLVSMQFHAEAGNSETELIFCGQKV